RTSPLGEAQIPYAVLRHAELRDAAVAVAAENHESRFAGEGIRVNRCELNGCIGTPFDRERVILNHDGHQYFRFVARVWAGIFPELSVRRFERRDTVIPDAGSEPVHGASTRVVELIGVALRCHELERGHRSERYIAGPQSAWSGGDVQGHARYAVSVQSGN